MLTVLAINLLGDGLRDALDPNSARGNRRAAIVARLCLVRGPLD
jgi:hypothetical protein